MKILKVGDVVRALDIPFKPSENDYGIILDVYEDDYGIYYYEVRFAKQVDWCKRNELELISESI